jgi:HEAT repeat protein
MQTHGFARNAAAALGLGATPAAPALDAAALDRAFEALKAYNWGTDARALDPIEDAAVAVLGDAAARKALEARLVAVLETDVSRDAKDVVCRMLRKMGSADSVAALARLLSDKDLSHMARYALERIEDPAAGAALRDALPKVAGALQAGVAGSLGARRDAAAVPALIELLGADDAPIAAAAATALGAIATLEAASALSKAAKRAPAAARPAVIDGALRAAEHLAVTGEKAHAAAVYKACAGDDMPEPARSAARRGLSKG